MHAYTRGSIHTSYILYIHHIIHTPHQQGRSVTGVTPQLCMHAHAHEYMHVHACPCMQSSAAPRVVVYTCMRAGHGADYVQTMCRPIQALNACIYMQVLFCCGAQPYNPPIEQVCTRCMHA